MAIRHIALSRLTPDGTPDETFGPGGVRLYQPPGFDHFAVRDAVLDSQQRIIVVGQGTTGGTTGMLACRFDAEGEPDLGFGDPLTGCRVIPGGSAIAEAVLIQPCPMPDNCVNG